MVHQMSRVTSDGALCRAQVVAEVNRLCIESRAAIHALEKALARQAHHLGIPLEGSGGGGRGASPPRGGRGASPAPGGGRSSPSLAGRERGVGGVESPTRALLAPMFSRSSEDILGGGNQRGRQAAQRH